MQKLVDAGGGMKERVGFRTHPHCRFLGKTIVMTWLDVRQKDSAEMRAWCGREERGTRWWWMGVCALDVRQDVFR